jgi:hypothetical protein
MGIIIDGDFGIIQNTVGAESVPTGTSVQRPSKPKAGMLRFNSTINTLEWYSDIDIEWVPIHETATKALTFTFSEKEKTWVIQHDQNTSFFQLKIIKDDGTIVNAPYSSDLNSITIFFTYPMSGTVSLIFELVNLKGADVT